jgi:hypothetical protein
MSETTSATAPSAMDGADSNQQAQNLEQPDKQPKPTETVDFWKQKAREQEKRAKDNASAAARLAEIEQAQMTESEKASKRIVELEAQLADREATTIRQRVALAKGVPAELVDRLRGVTEDEIAEDADRLMALVTTPPTPKPDPSQGGQPGGTNYALNGDPLLRALKDKIGIT